MKASEAIAELQSLIDTHGDLDIAYYEYDKCEWVEIKTVYFCNDSFTDESEVRNFIALDNS